jgi:hypothetical protein
MTELQNLPPGSVDILTLSAPQLSSLQSRLSQEVEHLTTSYTRLRSAQARFRDCIASIRTGVDKQADRTSAPLFTDSSNTFRFSLRSLSIRGTAQTYNINYFGSI